MEFLTTEQVAARLGITPRRVQAMAKSGRLPASRFGRSLMIKESDLALVAVRKRGRPPKVVGEEVEQTAVAPVVAATGRKVKRLSAKKTAKK